MTERDKAFWKLVIIYVLAAAVILGGIFLAWYSVIIQLPGLL